MLWIDCLWRVLKPVCLIIHSYFFRQINLFLSRWVRVTRFRSCLIFRFLSGIVRQIWSKSALITITWKVFKRFVVFPKADPFESFQCQLPTIPANAGGHRIKLLAKKIFFRSLPFSPFFAFFLPFSLGLPFFPFPSSPLDFLPFLFGPSLILSISFLFNFSPYHSQLKIFVQTN